MQDTAENQHYLLMQSVFLVYVNINFSNVMCNFMVNNYISFNGLYLIYRPDCRPDKTTILKYRPYRPDYTLLLLLLLLIGFIVQHTYSRFGTNYKIVLRVETCHNHGDANQTAHTATCISIVSLFTTS